MFGFGYGELLLVALIGMLIFGNRLPGAMKSLGEGIRVFKKSVREETESITALSSPTTEQQ